MEGGSSGISLCWQSVDKRVDKTTEGDMYIEVKIMCIDLLLFFRFGFFHESQYI